MFPTKNIDEFFVSENAEFEVLLSVLSKQVNSNYGSGFAIVVDVDVVILLSPYFKVDILSSEHFAVEVFYVFD